MRVAIDLETTSPKDPNWIHQCEIVGFSLAKAAGEAMYISGRPTQELFGEQEWVAHNAKFETIQLTRAGLTPPVLDDTKLMAYLLGKPSTHLKHLTKQELGIDPITYAQVTEGYGDMAEVPPSKVVDYAAADADHTLRLRNTLEPALSRLGLRQLYEQVERPLVPVLARMEMRGVRVDRREALRARLYFYRLMRNADANAHQPIPTEVNILSHDQLGAWLDQAGAPCRERTEVKNLPKTDANNLKWIQKQNWNPDAMVAILDLKEKQKLRSFAESFYRLSRWDGNLHPSFNQCGHSEKVSNDSRDSPVTGRLSSSGPNLQQVPHHGRGKGRGYEEYGQVLRRCLVARPGFVLLAADVGQQEPRITALVAPEPAMQNDFDMGVPIYAPIGEAIYGRQIDKHTDEPEWHIAKTGFLALVYGADWKKWMEIDPSLTESQARSATRRLQRRYVGLTDFRARVKLELLEHGYVRDWFGRIRWLPNIYSPEPQDRAEALRMAVNMKIQGPAASCIKLGMIYLDSQGWDILLQIHDEIVLEVLVEHESGAIEDIRKIGLPEVHTMPTNFPIEIKRGYNLGEMEDV